jgi:hypothetical protein
VTTLFRIFARRTSARLTTLGGEQRRSVGIV